MRKRKLSEGHEGGTAARSLHGLGVACGIAAGVWLGGAEAPVKLVVAGFSPFIVSLCMVAGVFVGRWTLPTVLKGTGYVFRDIRQRSHLVVWAILAGALWAVANTLTVFAIRDVGLSIAFPLWNTNCLVGLFWGWLLFRELRGAGARGWAKVLGGALAIAAAAVLLALASHQTRAPGERAWLGIVAAAGASLLWGTMYIPYRKAYLSGMNPLSFVTVFTIGELVTTALLALAFQGGVEPLLAGLRAVRPAAFWLFLGGFCWVIGDLFQQYATKYIGISRAIPLSNTNQLWGLAWAALVFGELAGAGTSARDIVIVGSSIMVLGAFSIGSAAAPETEEAACRDAIARECNRYRLNFEMAAASQRGEEPLTSEPASRRWWDGLIVAGAVVVFAMLASVAKRPPLLIDATWLLALAAIMLATLLVCGWILWKRTGFS